MLELVKTVKFSMAKNGLDLYLKALEKCNCMRLQHIRMEQTYRNVWKGKTNHLHTTGTVCESHSYKERNVEKTSQQFIWARRATICKSIGDVQSVNFHLWSIIMDQICNHKKHEEIQNKTNWGYWKSSKRSCTQMERMTPIWGTLTW